MINEALSKSLNRVIQHFDENSFSIISASRAIYDKDENNTRTQSLISDIRGLGLGFVKMKGRYIEGFGTESEQKPVQEDVLFVASKKMRVDTDTNTSDEKAENKRKNESLNEDFRNKMISLGEKYDQESIVFKPFGEDKAYLIGTVDIDEDGKKVWPGKGNSVPVGGLHPGRAGMFHTMLWKNQRTFTFESVEYPKSFMGTWADFLHKKAINESKT